MRKFAVFEKEGHKIMLPTEEFKCPFCGTPLVIHQEIVAKYPRKNFTHCDVHMKCPRCDWFTVFGVPISKEEYDELSKSKWVGVVFTDELINNLTDLNDDEKKIIEERLKSLGYW